MVVKTIEDALRDGGLALLGEGFQIDSSLSFGTEIQGEIDAVVPLWSEAGKNGYTGVVFAQPGLALWTGLADEGRIDTNLGVVYRSNLLNALTGIDVISGASIFYDSNFRRGHSRISLGVDAQHREFHGGVNYYQPVSDEVDGRTGYIEDAVRGIDARLEFQRDIMRVSGNLGFWRYDGIGKSDWKSSYGLDAGVQVSEGIFIEGGYEKHDDDTSIGDRLSLGVAFKYSLPDLEGRSYGEVPKSANLYQIVERERRILYQEQVAVTGPSVSVARGTIIRDGSEVTRGGIMEGDTVSVDIRLSEVLEESVTINLIGRGTAAYGANGDWLLDNGSGNCDSVEGAGCQVVIAAGQFSPGGDVEIAIRDDGDTGEDSENIILSMAVASAGDTGLRSPGSLVLDIEADPPLPSVSLSATSTSIVEGGNATLTATLTETVTEDVVINLLEGGAADYGTGMDWHLNNGSDCNTAIGTSCQITIPANQRSATATVNVNNDSDNETSAETFTVSIDVASTGSTGVITGSPSSLTFTIPADTPTTTTPTVSLNYSGSATVQEGSTVTMTIALSEALDENVSFNFSLGNDNEATYGISGDFVIRYDGNRGECSSINSCTPVPPTIMAGGTSMDISISILPDTTQVHTDTAAELVSLSLGIADAGSTGLILGSTTNQTFTIEANTPTNTTVGFTSATSNVNEPAGSSANTAVHNIPLTITGTIPSDFALSVNYDASSTANWDSSSGNVDFRRTETLNLKTSDTGTVNLGITIVGDLDDDDNETIVLDLALPQSNPPANVVLGTVRHTVTIIDDDEPSLPTASLKYSGSATVDATSNPRLQIELSSAASQDVKVEIVGSGDLATRYGYADGPTTWDIGWNTIPEGMPLPASFTGTATPCNSAVAPDACVITIPMGRTVADLNVSLRALPAGSLTLTLRINSDSTSLVTLGTPTAHALTVGAPTTTPTGGTVTFSDPSSASIAEAAGTATITATISPQLPADETVTVTIAPSGTAMKGTDYELSASSGTLTGNTWTLPTQSTSATLTITAKDTPGITTNRSLTLAFSGTTSTGGWSITDASRNITITDDDGARIGWSIAMVTHTAPMAGTMGVHGEGENYEATVILSKSPTTTVTVGVEVASDDATNSISGEFSVWAAIPRTCRNDITFQANATGEDLKKSCEVWIRPSIAGKSFTLTLVERNDSFATDGFVLDPATQTVMFVAP